MKHGFDGLFKRQRTPAKGGVAIFWQRSRWEAGLHRYVYLEQPGMRKTPGVQVALLKRWRSRFISRGDSNLASESKSVGGESIVVCTTHFRASADDHFRMQQASGAVKALLDFSRDEPQIIMADLNSQVRSDAEGHGKVDSVTVEPALWHVMLRLTCMLVLCRTVVSRICDCAPSEKK